MTNIFPTDYSTKWTPDWTDVVWSSDAVTNFNLTIASIALYTLTNSDTDSLSEWVTNLYYTEARVTSNTTVVWLWNTKADKTNVLELDNTTPYTPTLPYHPVTKDYSDNMGTVINWLTWKTTPVDNDEFILYDSVWLDNKKLSYSDLKTALTTDIVNTESIYFNNDWAIWDWLTRYISMSWRSNPEVSEWDSRMVISKTGTIKNLSIKALSNDLDENTVITVIKNGVATSLSVTFTWGWFEQDLVNTVSVIWWDFISIKIDTILSTVWQLRVSWALEFI